VKKYLLVLINMVMIIQVYCQTYTDKKGNVHLWGEASVNDLSSGQFEEWYTKNSEAYKSELSKTDGELLADTKVKVFLGTWCGDTKFLVPKFIKTWQQMGLSEDDLELIALHREGNNYKQGPNEETIGYNIHKVPTMVFEKNGEEIGRIVERTIFDLDTDILQIVKGNPYEERYQGVTILDRIMNEMDLDSLFIKENLNKIYSKVRREVSTSSELNAYGYVLKAQGELRKAEFVFLLNRYMFSYDPNVWDSQGEILMTLEKWEEARLAYEEVLRLKGADENAVKQLHKIYAAIEKEPVKEAG